ncbi:cell surface protein ErfK family [Streptococcus equi subsp. equi]|nr:hypothetical protein [Streptococcus equi]ASB97289.1 Cell surface protein ErfK family [Streptococcus equi subsp. equi]MBT1194745.1 hypothetical protein [Streptococcus equi subsp. equi]MBT1196813.1 hypothetical protein [Streptococcus equi subsp. equi]MBT1199558.1 hypothetical protein [Streptococcus equi subsp. equi]MBT1202364.1 hypothetical protein [Streptococcus equi subsp. equi]
MKKRVIGWLGVLVIGLMLGLIWWKWLVADRPLTQAGQGSHDHSSDKGLSAA